MPTVFCCVLTLSSVHVKYAMNSCALFESVPDVAGSGRLTIDTSHVSAATRSEKMLKCFSLQNFLYRTVKQPGLDVGTCSVYR